MKKIIWNLVGRFLGRRQAKSIHAEAERQAEERAHLVALFATNPGLHARVMLTGRRFVHYIELKDLAELHARVADQPEIKCILN
ncbi:hypothetical protein ES703_25812 [subsurface metagenome]